MASRSIGPHGDTGRVIYHDPAWYLLTMGQRVLKSDADALCPYCGGSVSFKIDFGGIIHQAKDKQLLMATGKTGCEAFDKLETADDFIRFTRETREAVEKAARS